MSDNGAFNGGVFVSGTLPNQKISSDSRTKEFGIRSMQAFKKLLYIDQKNSRTSRQKKIINYNLYNGYLHLKDLEYVLNQRGLGNTDVPANLAHYDNISPKINLLLGEEIKRPFNLRVVAKNPEVVSSIEQKQKDMMFDLFMKTIQDEVSSEDRELIKDPTAPVEPKTPAEVQKFMLTSYKEMKEIVGQQALTYLVEEQKLKLKFNQGFKHAFIAGEEIYYVGNVSGEPVVRVVNPINLWILKNPDSDFIDEAYAIIEERYLTISSVIDEFWRDLTPTDIDKLQRLTGVSKGGDFNYEAAGPVEIMIRKEDNDVEFRRSSGYDERANTIRVRYYEWKSMMQVGILTTPTDVIEVDDNFKVPEYATKDKDVYHWTDEATGEVLSLEWFWINVVMQGQELGEGIFVGVEIKENQRRSIDNISECKLGYVGYIYNATNSIETSLVDRLKPYQYLLNILHYRLELAIAKTKGKVTVMDIAQIPTSEGWDVDKWLHYLEAMGVMFINSAEEGKNGERPSYNQFTALDLTLGNYIDQHVKLIDSISNQMGELSGVTRQRQGQIGTNELVGNAERSVLQSSHITEIWFYFHNEVKKRVCEALLDVAKITWREGKKINHVMSDLTRMFFTIDGDDFTTSDYGVFVSDSNKEERILSTLEQMAYEQARNGNIVLSEAINILESESIAAIKAKLQESEAARAQLQQQNVQAEREEKINLQREAQQFRLLEIDREDARNVLDNETKLRIAFNNNETKKEVALLDGDKDDDGIPDVLELKRFELEREKFVKEAKLKEKELDIKEKIGMKPKPKTK